jgi:hypothetical protein
VNETPGLLAGLHDVVAPPPVSWAPQTVGWAVVAAALVVLLAWLGWQAWKKAKANRYRKVALAEIDRVEGALRDDPSSGRAALGAVNAILKRTALTAWPRPEVASLAGEEWLEFLDATVEGRDFRGGPGRALADQVYAPGGLPTAEDERQAFLAAVRRWIRSHRRSDATHEAGVPGPVGRGSRSEEEAA